MAEATGRAANGTFAKGHHHSRGNPFVKELHAMRVRLYNAVSNEDFDAVVKKMIELAREGSIQAAKLLIEHLAGKPHQSIHLTGTDSTSTDKLNVADVQLAIVEALIDEPAAKLKVTRALKALYERAKSTDNGESS
jgi:hypothetical protein